MRRNEAKINILQTINFGKLLFKKIFKIFDICFIIWHKMKENLCPDFVLILFDGFGRISQTIFGSVWVDLVLKFRIGICA